MSKFEKNELYHSVKFFLVQNFPGFKPQDYNLVTSGLMEKFEHVLNEAIEEKEIENSSGVPGVKVPKTKGLFSRVSANGEGVWVKSNDRVINQNDDFEVQIVDPVTGDFGVSKFTILK